MRGSSRGTRKMRVKIPDKGALKPRKTNRNLMMHDHVFNLTQVIVTSRLRCKCRSKTESISIIGRDDNSFVRKRSDDGRNESLSLYHDFNFDYSNRGSICSEKNRRFVLQATTAAPLLLNFLECLYPLACHAEENIRTRLDTDPRSTPIIQPSYNIVPWSPKILYYPRWMFGEWELRRTLRSVIFPLGESFVPEGFLQAVTDTETETEKYKARFFSTFPDTFDNSLRVNLGLGMPKQAIIADKAYNTKSMTESMLGYPGSVEKVEYNPRDSPLRQTIILSKKSPEGKPLPPRKIEIYVNGLRSEQVGDDIAFEEGNLQESSLKIRDFRTSEVARQVYVAIRDVQVYDYEIINEYSLVSEGFIKGRQRSILYLHPQDALYFKTLNGLGVTPVAVYDYEFEMKRCPPPEDAPSNATSCVETPKGVFQCI